MLSWLKTDTAYWLWMPLILAALLANLALGHFPLKHGTDGALATWVRTVTQACESADAIPNDAKHLRPGL